MLDGVRLDETSSAAVAVTGWRDRLYLAWTGTDKHVNLASSPDGREFSAKQRLDDQSYRKETGGGQQNVALAPSLAVSGEHLYLAWTVAGAPGHLITPYVNLLTSAESPDGAPAWVHEPVRVYEVETESAPALCSHQGHLVLGWEDCTPWGWITGKDRRISILAGPEGPRDARVRLDETRTKHFASSTHTRTGPALCSHDGRLIVAWTGGDHRINILAGGENPHGGPVRLEQAWSRSAPALCSHQGRLILAWTAGDHRVYMLTDPKGPHDAPIWLEEARSGDAPALCSHQGRLILAWAGTDKHVNLAQLP